MGNAAENIEVRAVLFAAAMICVSNEETRYYLNGVYIQPHPEKGVMLVATDGHRLVVIHDETGRCAKPAIIRADKPLASILNKLKADNETRFAVDTAGIVSMPGAYIGATSAIIDGTFPDWTRVVHPMLKQLKAATFTPATFNHGYLTSFGRIAAKLSSTSDRMRVVSVSDKDAALILWSGFPSAFGILMPIADNITNGLPLFIKPVIEPKRAAPKSAKPQPKPVRKPSRKAA